MRLLSVVLGGGRADGEKLHDELVGMVGGR
jgi:hypothetical protein